MALQLKPVESRRLYQQIADQIRELIDRGGFEAGMRLPPERDLALQLGVSRPSLREALIALDVEGRVEVRGGSGVYVSAARPSPAPGRTSSLGESPSQLMEARSVIEGEVVVLACARITDEQSARLRDIVRSMASDIERRRARVDLDREFHLTLAEMSGNAVLVRLVAELFDERHSPISAKLSSRFESTRTWKAALAEHEAVLHAIEARDPIAAQAAMRTHLRASTLRWVGE
ncbi:FadR/GntR family transcriptional regulator [Aquabacterium humicola]|uniref:FadR/GntR family transcriptional regulator n=1 Tax=Aquabacterium humicola TaxID=3237377 RepID=UPI0025428E57|nr:FadR/GntR family transcriptional regulator [Rubrivivax pictus]